MGCFNLPSIHSQWKQEKPFEPPQNTKTGCLRIQPPLCAPGRLPWSGTERRLYSQGTENRAMLKNKTQTAVLTIDHAERRATNIKFTGNVSGLKRHSRP